MVQNKHATLTNTLLSQWQSGGLLSDALLPLSWVTRLVVAARAALYLLGLKQPNRMPVPVIVVGNIFVGGTGKTPFVLSLVAALRERGWQPGIVSRGYGVTVGHEPRHGYGAQAQAAYLGDEPSMLASAAPIAIHPDRTRAARCLLQQYPEITVIIADDGLQHRALGRDIEIAVQDSRGIGNGRLLPAGPLREPASRLNSVDYLVSNIPADEPVIDQQAHTRASQGQREARRVTMQLLPARVVHLLSGQSLSPDQWRAQYRGKRIAAIAGIGHPPRFFRTLAYTGIVAQQTIAFADHHAYSRDEIQAIDADLILMTAKDAAKCLTMQDDRLWSLEVTPRFSDPDFFDDIAKKLKSLPVY
ncbi:tetraacyldisaccharide 4'-kinase [Advenella sp. S44]|uniref:tetraacyldisaccharide 4'-kinase n=1 Tax=Advenella sp. S44 TaxID=1982755 RepID=UPI000C2A9515|nr:tetraacyldisaccharide 4'-kinase [Advenella sp. S44]PJX23083.1 tetraacyldisaccharide 4'-kinase [Advenella sp. S44]